LEAIAGMNASMNGVLFSVHATGGIVPSLRHQITLLGSISMRKFILALGLGAMVLPTVLIPVSAADARDRREWRGRDGRTYCKRSNGTTGTIIGGVGGALLGRTVDTRGDRTVGTLGGAVLGGLAGRAIDKGSSNNNRRCR
jgi:hypothetical protein